MKKISISDILNVILATAVIVLVFSLSKENDSSITSKKIQEQAKQLYEQEAEDSEIMPSEEKLESGKFAIPAPVAIVGTKIDGKVNYMAAAFVGVVASDPLMISLGVKDSRYTIKGILQNKSFSINIPSKNQLHLTDVVGTISGRDMDKTKLFKVFYGDNPNAPLISEAPVNFECELVTDVGDWKNRSHHILLAKVTKIHISKNMFTDGKPDMAKINPIIDGFGSSTYFSLGKPLEKVGFSKRDKKEE